jgi:hypothetical protein
MEFGIIFRAGVQRWFRRMYVGNSYMHIYGEVKRLVASGAVEELHDMAREGRELESHRTRWHQGHGTRRNNLCCCTNCSNAKAFDLSSRS